MDGGAGGSRGASGSGRGGGYSDGYESSRSQPRGDDGFYTDDDDLGASSAAEFDSAVDTGSEADSESGDDELIRGMRGLGVGGGGSAGQGRGGQHDGGDGGGAQQPSFSIEEVREAFDAFDGDGDGFLDAEDVLMFFKALGEDPSLEDIEAMVQKAAARNGGKVDFADFYAMAVSSPLFW